MSSTLNQNYYCPILQELMEDPVMDPEGNTYERSAITEWLNIRHCSPLTRSPMEASSLVPNRALKAAIDDERANLPRSHPDGTAPLDINAEMVINLPTAQLLSVEVTSIPTNKILVGAGAAGSSEESFIMTNVIAPADSTRVPTDIVVCIDTSGSMGMEATAQGVESSGLNMLDIVKHAVKTIIKTCNADDRVGIVNYSNKATKVCDLTSMTDTGKNTAITKLEALDTMGMTNLWDGLKTCLDMLCHRDEATIFSNVPSNKRNGAIYLLTDGVPNVDPPRGYIPSLQRYKDQHGGKYPGVLNTFGFGYNLKSDLLLELAEEGQGTYAFIPDSGFVGTVFVNALGNTLTTVANDLVVGVSAENASNDVKAVCMSDVFYEGCSSSSSSNELNFKGRTVQIGQPFGHITQVPDTELPLIFANVKYTSSVNQQEVVLTATGPTEPANETQTQEIASEYFRCISINCMKLCLEKCKNDNFHSAQEDIINVILLIDNYLACTEACVSRGVPGDTRTLLATSRARIEGLREDLNGQIKEACSSRDYYHKWGSHFIRSIMRAHQLKQCNNFKDPGVQFYGNTAFENVRDDADDIFSAMPPPTPAPVNYAAFGVHGSGSGSGYSGSVGGGAPAAPAPRLMSMASYNDRSAGCVHEDSTVTLVDGSTCLAREIKKGDVISSGGIVHCVVKTVVSSGSIDMVSIPTPTPTPTSGTTGTTTHASVSNLLITAYHPVLVDNNWQFPCKVPNAQLVTAACTAVYSFVIKSGTVANRYTTCALVNNIPTAMLAHGVLNVPCLSHPFFGTHAVIDALVQCCGYEQGLVTFTEENYPFRRVEGNGDVCGIIVENAITTVY